MLIQPEVDARSIVRADSVESPNGKLLEFRGEGEGEIGRADVSGGVRGVGPPQPRGCTIHATSLTD